MKFVLYQTKAPKEGCLSICTAIFQCNHMRAFSMKVKLYTYNIFSKMCLPVIISLFFFTFWLLSADISVISKYIQKINP